MDRGSQLSCVSLQVFLNQVVARYFFAGKDITNLDAAKRHINTVFQNYALFPHLDVFENVAFGLKIKKESNERD